MIINDAFLPTQSAAADLRTGPINVGDYGNYFIGVTFSGADVVGTLTLEASATKDFARSWTVANSSTAITASGDAYWNISDVNYPYVRVFWDYTSGTGNITIDYTIRQPRLWGGG